MAPPISAQVNSITMGRKFKCLTRDNGTLKVLWSFPPQHLFIISTPLGAGQRSSHFSTLFHLCPRLQGLTWSRLVRLWKSLLPQNGHVDTVSKTPLGYLASPGGKARLPQVETDWISLVFSIASSRMSSSLVCPPKRKKSYPYVQFRVLQTQPRGSLDWNWSECLLNYYIFM